MTIIKDVKYYKDQLEKLRDSKEISVQLNELVLNCIVEFCAISFEELKKFEQKTIQEHIQNLKNDPIFKVLHDIPVANFNEVHYTENLDIYSYWLYKMISENFANQIDVKAYLSYSWPNDYEKRYKSYLEEKKRQLVGQSSDTEVNEE